ncbi:MAG TPA: AI-2E family transporter [Actinophytocola sp.]|uniref:AI-2E family transporter n=1 Tax=Actinophytocola sp. TaxID=1872138 RepID=UPI002DB5B278|nr:AI-2E family transporter [Actinophytocola sp.]HEU5473514.1 AI-2E family transporter [Actinophytocola sp.]
MTEAELVHEPPGRAPLPRGLVILLGLSAAVITGAGIWAAAWLIGPVFLALVIVISVSPLQSWLLRHGTPRWLAVATLILAVYAILASLFLVIIVSVARLASVVPEYAERADELLGGVRDFLAQLGVDAEQVDSVANSVDLTKLADLLGSLLGTVGGILSNLVFLFSLLLFLSFETTSATARLRVIAADRPRIADALGEFVHGTRSYMVVSTVFGLMVAVLDTIALALLGIPLPVTWGLLSFITNYIPNVGFIIGVIPPALLGLLGGGPGLMLAVIAVYIVFNFVCQSLIQPRFVGNAVGLSSTIAFLALLFWAWLIGALGAILAIPLTLLAKALLVDVDPGARWADALLGVQRPPPRAERKAEKAERKAERAAAKAKAEPKPEAGPDSTQEPEPAEA